MARLNKVLPRIETSTERGLTHEQARERLDNGYSNSKPDSAEKTVGQIFKDNILTYFNMLITLLAILIISVGGEMSQLAFVPIIIFNTAVGIMQELRSKKMLSQLSFISAPQATVIRNREQMSVPSDETVLDDIVIFGPGQQIYADAIVVSGECQANEALVTGESDEITKTVGDTLLSGSFIISGGCTARLDKVGRDSFVAQLMMDAKKTKSKLSAGMVSALRKLIMVIGIIIIPLGILMFLRQMGMTRADDALLRTIAAIIGMLPNGLFMLVSVTLTVSVMRLAKRKTLIQDRNCVETLARVDVLCVDKTGTITENKMEVKGAALLCWDRYDSDKINAIMADYAGNMNADNETMVAVHAYFGTNARRRARKALPFSSAVKYSAVSFASNESYILGAPERILISQYPRYQATIESYSAQGYRVLLLAHYDGDLEGKLDDKRVLPIALIMLSNRVRAEAPGTFKYFREQGVKIIVISGDNPVTVSQIAREAGIEGAEHYVDAAELQTDKQFKRAVKEYTVFGRVTPDQKRKLVRALKKAGHTVAMTGDGVNDVLAMKDSNCSIAMAEGSEVASQVADIVLLNSDFSALPSVVMEGRRVINNIERCATLYMSKNFSALFFAIFVVIAFGELFPLWPSQYMAYEMFFIGIPSYFLALQSNTSIVKGKFIWNVFRGALPAGLTVFGVWALIYYFYGSPVPEYFSSTDSYMANDISTMVSIVIAFVGLLLMVKLCFPLNKIKIAVSLGMTIVYIVSVSLFGDMIFSIVPVSGDKVLMMAASCFICIPVMVVLTLIFEGKRGFVQRLPNN